MARLNVYIFHCSRCGEPAYALLKERTPGGVESGDTIFPTIDLKAIRAQCSACKHTQFRDAGENAHFALLGRIGPPPISLPLNYCGNPPSAALNMASKSS